MIHVFAPKTHWVAEFTESLDFVAMECDENLTYWNVMPGIPANLTGEKTKLRLTRCNFLGHKNSCNTIGKMFSLFDASKNYSVCIV